MASFGLAPPGCPSSGNYGAVVPFVDSRGVRREVEPLVAPRRHDRGARLVGLALLLAGAVALAARTTHVGGRTQPPPTAATGAAAALRARVHVDGYDDDNLEVRGAERPLSSSRTSRR